MKSNFSLGHCFTILSQHPKWLPRAPKTKNTKKASKKQAVNAKVANSALAHAGGAEGEEEEEKEKEDEGNRFNLGPRSVGRKQTKAQEANQRGMEKQLEKALSAQAEMVKKDNKHIDLMKENTKEVQKSTKIFENTTLALTVHTTALQRAEDICILFMDPLSIENPIDCQMILQHQHRIREREIWNGPVINNSGNSDTGVPESN
ncbi:hypothetical protein PHYBLDRAFT_165413 [Phycomyces blakesleeanus NRRL 1555(-)]|uniref:No apical meristem-associated C-terminal domain-containing protein n=1 Tax=Phycomyces blakesleeanus (strain ATCC 8743b / DSM 1359 / FGSC 10004 / NBRC 33097 / NRRL 1555) TaxID=763407 RepID=A0A167NZ31_PHYB8|nr:hypothetical protein PHYBLDRAFT_165413 [Phycomyces blakesleeanus NRRL 1555(-)]OAD76918.1 hypothetical protein PHYBLDRAFT_165413 [Phycomyces blakesleeanus NRRL 1555(-)]|eukprot:XP_018294958.1 hypothetical protein PHYBLDRAFT_165413 [Phycomyces blakesleeanus NRRL 1555(-)]